MIKNENSPGRRQVNMDRGHKSDSFHGTVQSTMTSQTEIRAGRKRFCMKVAAFVGARLDY